jgi:putative redox protein
MGQMQCDTKWQGGLRFSTKIRKHQFMMDSISDPQSQDAGPTPKELLLAGICGCTGMDVASILAKMRLQIDSCEVSGQTETTESHPSIFKEVHLQFLIAGPQIKAEQAMKAVVLSMTKYCGVSAMVAEASPILYEVVLNGQKVGAGKADFSGAFAESRAGL